MYDTSFDVWYLDWCISLLCVDLGDYSFVIGIHFVRRDCDWWITYLALACNWLHWQATMWIIYSNNSKDMFCVCTILILCALFEKFAVEVVYKLLSTTTLSDSSSYSVLNMLQVQTQIVYNNITYICGTFQGIIQVM